MRIDTANTLHCPLVARKCQADKCMFWEDKEGHCLAAIFLKRTNDVARKDGVNGPDGV